MQSLRSLYIFKNSLRKKISSKKKVEVRIRASPSDAVIAFRRVRCDTLDVSKIRSDRTLPACVGKIATAFLLDFSQPKFQLFR